MKIAMSFSSADEGLENLLEYLGVILKCESVHIFEDINNLYFKNTYEWCLKENFSKKESLREINHSYIDKCLKRFREKRNIIIKDIENAKKFDNKLYKYLKDNHIHTLVACPLIDNNKVIGILAVINPPIELIDNIASLFQIMSYFIVLILNRRTLMKQLEKLSYYDQLTGFGNRHAMNKFVDSLNEDDSLGLVYCDVTGLKKINDTLGHKAGDAVLIRTCQCLKETFKDNYMFRLGGDEFLVICPQIEEEKLLYQVDILKENMKNYNVVLAVGSVFSEKSSVDFDKLLSIADKKMYEDKRRYYKEKDYG
jgi:diguanylate cyclase (GGDEF)-like protein